MTQLDKTQRVFRPIFAYACFRIFHVSYPAAAASDGSSSIAPNTAAAAAGARTTG